MTSNKFIALTSVGGTLLLVYFLLSPVLLLPADPEFARLTIGKPNLMIDGQSWIPIYGLHLALQVPLAINLLASLIMTISLATVMLVSPFTVLLKKKKLLILLGGATNLCLLCLLGAFMAFSSYIDADGFGSGIAALISIFCSVGFKARQLRSDECKKVQKD
jgi:hypothetical protein